MLNDKQVFNLSHNFLNMWWEKFYLLILTVYLTPKQLDPGEMQTDHDKPLQKIEGRVQIQMGKKYIYSIVIHFSVLFTNHQVNHVLPIIQWDYLVLRQWISLMKKILIEGGNYPILHITSPQKSKLFIRELCDNHKIIINKPSFK